jgi:hypothetical protein
VRDQVSHPAVNLIGLHMLKKTTINVKCTPPLFYPFVMF